jgi:hypothetical protein
MANTNDPNENRWVDERLRSLATPEVTPNLDAARGRLRERDASARRRRRAWTTAAVIVGGILVLAALPWPRAAAQRLWDRLTLVRVEVVPVAQDNLRPEKLFDFKEEGDEPINVQDVVEAERVAGFRPLLPSPDVVPGIPQLKVVKHEVMSSTVRVADLERALAASGVTGVRVPREWEGVTLRVERGPVIDAEYEDAKMGVSQSPPFRLIIPSGFQVGQFMEILYRLFGKSVAEAHDLSRKFVENPAWMLTMPHATVREVPWKGGRAVAAGGQGMCFFWNTTDRIFVIGAQKMDPDFGVAVANSVQ